MTDSQPSLETLEEELDVVMDRHNDILRGDHGERVQTRAYAVALKVLTDKMMKTGATPPEIEVNENVAHVGWPDQRVVSFFGDVEDPGWTDEPLIDVAQYDIIELAGVKTDAE